MGTTKEQRDELRKIAELATSGEWTVDDANDELVARLVDGAYEYIAIADPSEFSVTEMTHCQCAANARHIAAFSPVIVLSLLSDADERDRLDAERLTDAAKIRALEIENSHFKLARDTLAERVRELETRLRMEEDSCARWQQYFNGMKSNCEGWTNRAETAEANFRHLSAIMLGDGGRYHDECGAEAAIKECSELYSAWVERSCRAEAKLENAQSAAKEWMDLYHDTLRDKVTAEDGLAEWEVLYNSSQAKLAEAVDALEWLRSNPGAHPGNMIGVAEEALSKIKGAP